MAKDRKKLQHIHSSVPDKQPTPSTLAVGEIAVNNAANQEFLSIRNSEDKVKRFSSDEQMITWVEKKEVIPYAGFTRGSDGPTGSTGPNSVTNNDLLQNKSNLIIKFNQVAASNTAKHDVVNGSKDIYNLDVNPTSDSGVTDGAGFAIDMSRYAMIGANPSFSSLTVTDKTDLSGNTTISNGDGSGTRTGNTLKIETTNVNASDSVWKETIITKTEKINSRDTTVGTENLHISGTTTEVRDGAVSETNNSTTTIDRKGVVSENNQNNVTVVTSGNSTTTVSGNVVSNTSGTTTETKKGNITETNLADKKESTSGNSYNDVKVNYSGTTGGTTTEVKTGAVSETNSSTTNLTRVGAVTIANNATKTETTNGVVTENNKSTHNVNTTGATNITRTGIVTEDNKNNVARTTSGTTTETFKGQVTENNQSGYTVNTTGNVITNTTGTTTEVKVGNVTENTSGTTTIDRKGAVSENNLATKTENTSGLKTENNSNNYVVNTSGNTTFMTTGNTAIHSDGAVGITAVDDITAASSESSIILTANDDLCATAGDITALNGANKTNVGIDCSDGARTKVTNIYGDAINKRANTADTRVTSAYTNATTATTVIGTANTSATTADYSGNTLNSHISDVTHSGDTLNITEKTSTTIKSPDTTVSGTSLTINEATSVSAKTPTTYVSGTTMNITETNVNVNSCGKISGKTNAYSMEECATGGTHSVKYHTSSVSGTNFNVTETTSIINSTNTNLTGTNLTIKESATTLSSTTATFSGTTLNETFTNGNFNITNYDLNGNNICISGTTKANVYGATTNVGIDCNGTTTASTINVSGATINEGGTTLNGKFTNINFSGTTKISGGTTIGGATTINNNLNVTGNTNITGATNISGATKIDDDLTVTGKLYLQVDCGSSVTSTTVNAAICESMDRSVVTMTKTTPAATSEILATYKLFQNGAQVGEDINIPKDHLLRDVSIVYGKANGSSFTACTSTATDCHWYIKLVWNVNDPSTGHSDDKVTYLPADDFIKDIDDSNPSGIAADSSYNNVAVNVWYDGKQNWISATTTPTIHASQNIYADGNISGTNITASTAIRANNVSANTITAATDVRANNVSANTLSAATSIATKDLNASGNATVTGALTLTSGIAKKVSWQAGSFTADTTGYNGSADKVITVPTAVSHLTRGKFTVTHNGLSDTFDPSTDKSMTFPHSALTIDYGVVVTGKTDDSYDTSAAKTVSIPTAVSHISRGSLSYSHNGFSGTFDPASNATFSSPHSALSFSYGSVSAKSGSDSYNTSAEKSITIPTSIDHLSNWNGSCIELPHNVCVTGTITASGAIYSSDRDLKENINFVQREDFNKAKNVAIKSFNFKDDENKNKIYGVIAQEVQDAGLDELVYQKEDGHLAVDYTSLMMLRIAYLEDFCAHLNRGVSHLLLKVKELEDKLNSVN